MVIPEHVQKDVVTIPHIGFSDRQFDAASAYFNHYGINLPSTPLLPHEFSNPLFLKMFCEGMSGRGIKEIPRGSYGISEVFKRVLDNVNVRISSRLDYNPDNKPVHDALLVFAAELARRRARQMPQQDAAKIVDLILPAPGFSGSLYRALVDEGLLFERLDFGNQDTNRKIVSISYDRWADHLIAEHFIDVYIEEADPAAAFQSDGTLAFLLDEDSFVWRGVLEALCIQIPEKFGCEFPVFMGALYESRWGRSALLASLIWRSRRGCSDDTVRQFSGLLRQNDGLRRDEAFDTLVAIATIPDHPLNAEYLHDLLQHWPMPDRDALWSTYLHQAYTYERGGPVVRLVDWRILFQPKLVSRWTRTRWAWPR
jgi:hypothetical protein